MSWPWIIPVLLCLLVQALRPLAASAVVAAAVTAGIIYLKIVSVPLIDQAASARPLWRQIAGHADQVCVEQMHRAWRYGLNYYSVTPLPDCGSDEKPLHVIQDDAKPPAIH